MAQTTDNVVDSNCKRYIQFQSVCSKVEKGGEEGKDKEKEEEEEQKEAKRSKKRREETSIGADDICNQILHLD